MLIAKFNGYRVKKNKNKKTPMAFRLVPFEPLFHCAIISDTRYSISRENEGSILHPKQTAHFVDILSR